MDVVNEGKTKFVPDRFSKTYLRWMENVHDWCISRQLWWGHRIPAFYCDDCGEMTVSKTDVCTCPKCGSKNIRQEEDVLDTWFSSALWPSPRSAGRTRPRSLTISTRPLRSLPAMILSSSGLPA